jgi:hypothetical protein
MAGEMTVISTRIKKKFLDFSGYQYRIHLKNSNLIILVFFKGKSGKCKCKLKTNLRYRNFSKTDYSCVSELAGAEV